MEVLTYKGRTLIISGIQDIIDTLILDSETSELGELLKRYHERYIAEASEHDLEIDELEKEVQTLKTENNALKNQISEMQDVIIQYENYVNAQRNYSAQIQAQQQQRNFHQQNAQQLRLEGHPAAEPHHRFGSARRLCHLCRHDAVQP